MVTGSSSLEVTGGFTWLVTPGSRGMRRGAFKLTRTSTVIKKKKKPGKHAI